MKNEALIVVDIQNDITKNYKEIIDNINRIIDWANNSDRHIIYIRHENLSPGTRTFKPNTNGAKLADDLKVISPYIFTKTKGNALTSKEFTDYLEKNEISNVIITGADATACIKSTCYNLRKKDYSVTVLEDCITSYNKNKIIEMLDYYNEKGCKISKSIDLLTLN